MAKLRYNKKSRSNRRKTQKGGFCIMGFGNDCQNKTNVPGDTGATGATTGNPLVTDKKDVPVAGPAPNNATVPAEDPNKKVSSGGGKSRKSNRRRRSNKSRGRR